MILIALNVLSARDDVGLRSPGTVPENQCVMSKNKRDSNMSIGEAEGQAVFPPFLRGRSWRTAVLTDYERPPAIVPDSEEADQRRATRER